jgi:hypothetical protein
VFWISATRTTPEARKVWHRADRLDPFGPVPGLFQELPRRRLRRCLSRIDDATGYLQGDLSRAVAVLANQHQLVVGGDRNHVYPFTCVDPEEGMEFACEGRPGHAATDREDLALL